MYEFYARHFLNQNAPDLELLPVSRTIGQERLVDELIAKTYRAIVGGGSRSGNADGRASTR